MHGAARVACGGLVGLAACAALSVSDTLEHPDDVEVPPPHIAVIPERESVVGPRTSVDGCSTDDRDLLAGLPGRAVNEERGSVLRSKFGQARFVEIAADTCLVLSLEPPDSPRDVVVTLVREDGGIVENLAHGRFSAEPNDRGEGWGVSYRLMRPEGASRTPLSLPGADQVFSIDLHLSYWGGAGAGLVTHDHKVAYLVARRRDRLELVLAALHQENWVAYPGCETLTNDCMENEVPQPHTRRAELRAVGCPPTTVVLRQQGGLHERTSRWNARMGHFEPLYLSD